MDTTPTRPLARFRAELYQSLALRRDALADLLDAVLTGERITSLVRCSLSPCFQRRWPSLFDALSDGRLDPDALTCLWMRTLPSPPPGRRLLWAIDGSTWPRPEARTSPERTCCRYVTAGIPESGILPGWEYQWLVALPDATGSWVLPLQLQRRTRQAGTATQLAIAQLQRVLAAHPPPARPVVVLDSHYDVPALAAAVPEVDFLARLAVNRVFYQAPPPPPALGRWGRPRVHGPRFRCADPATHPNPDQRQVLTDPEYGSVVLERWDQLHRVQTPSQDLTLIRVRVAHLPRRTEPPQPLWLVWCGQALPVDLRQLWHWYQRRFGVEHAFRFLKQDLGWTVPRVRAPQTADRWSWLLACVLWQLWLARPVVAEVRLPWEHAPRQGRPLSPGRVRRGMAALLLTLGSRAPPPRVRGKASGRQAGQRPGRAPRFPVERRVTAPRQFGA